MDENTVVNEQQQAVQDDAVLEPMQEQQIENVSSLDEVTGDQPEQQPEQEQQQPARKEPGWVRKRVDEAVLKASQDTEARVRAEMKAEFESMLAPLRESMYERQAEALVASGEIKSKETALKYVKAMAGVPEAPQAKATPKEGDAEAKAYAKLLASQASKIKAARGLDVNEVYNTDPEVKAKVLSGEWDFYDVAEAMSQPKRRVPSPVRSSNSAMMDSTARAVANMSDAQFDRLLKNLEEGKVYDMR